MSDYVPVDRDDPYVPVHRRDSYQSAAKKSHVTTESALNDAWVRARTAVVNLEDSYSALRSVGETKISKRIQKSLRGADEACTLIEELSMEKFKRMPGR